MVDLSVDMSDFIEEVKSGKYCEKPQIELRQSTEDMTPDEVYYYSIENTFSDYQ